MLLQGVEPRVMNHNFESCVSKTENQYRMDKNVMIDPVQGLVEVQTHLTI